MTFAQFIPKLNMDCTLGGVVGEGTGTKIVRSGSRPCRTDDHKARISMAGLIGQDEPADHSRRLEARNDEPQVCAYGLCESTDEERLVIEQGKAYCLNRSQHGILVLMGRRPRFRQHIEFHVAETRWEHSLNLYEVQWTKSVPVESHGELFLVGCRLVLRASRYWLF
jgi:hypothetical protein